jgi:hypothetical protein
MQFLGFNLKYYFKLTQMNLMFTPMLKSTTLAALQTVYFVG